MAKHQGRDPYGHHHRKQRATQLPHAYGQPCPRCGQPMLPGQDLDLGHTDDIAHGGADSPRRIEHAHCNRQAGQAVSAKRRKRQPINTRRW